MTNGCRPWPCLHGCLEGVFAVGLRVSERSCQESRRCLAGEDAYADHPVLVVLLNHLKSVATLVS